MVRNLVRRHGRRLVSFMTCGGFVFALSAAMMYSMVTLAGMHSTPAYVLQSFICMVLNFELNRRFSWKDRSVGYFVALGKFTSQNLIVTLLKTVSITALVWLGVYYMYAFVGLVVFFGIVRYVGCHFFVFAEKHSEESAADESVTSSPTLRAA